jgi:hypothetical protein
MDVPMGRIDQAFWYIDALGEGAQRALGGRVAGALRTARPRRIKRISVAWLRR